MFGLPPEAEITYALFLSLIHPEDRLRVDQHVQKAIGPGGSEDYNVDFRIVRPDGALRWIVGKGRTFFQGSDGTRRAVRMIGTSMDVTEQKNTEQALRLSEERLRLATEAAQVGTWDWDLLTNQNIWDSRSAQLLGLPANEPISHDRFLAIVHPDDRHAAVQRKEAALKERGEFQVEFRVIRPDGSTRWLLSRGHAFYDEHGRAIRMMGVVMDTTARREYENRLCEEKDQAEGANRAKDQFLATLSHELRTPLTPVLIGAEAMARDEKLPDDVREELRMIGQNVSLEARLIDDLLDLTRIVRGKLQLAFEAVDVRDVLRRTAETCRADLTQKSLCLEMRPEAQHTTVWGDPARLQQVFLNLLKNSIKFTPDGGRIGIRTWSISRPSGAAAAPAGEQSPAAGDWDVGIEVWDTGIGIEPDHLGTIFNAFEQGGWQVTQRFGGLGLGLAISKAIVEMHGGSIDASSAGKGKGAQFAITLPTIAAPMPQAGPARETRPVVGRRLRILLVEDHESTAKVLASLLRSFDHHVDVAATVQEALKLSGEHEYDLIVSDLGLPDGSGLDLMRQLRQRTPIAGIALSGYGMEEDVRRSREAGFAQHLIKPVNLQQLQTALANAMP